MAQDDIGRAAAIEAVRKAMGRGRLLPDPDREVYRGNVLPFREMEDGRHEWATPTILKAVGDAAKRVAGSAGTSLGPMERPSLMSEAQLEEMLGDAGAATGLLAGTGFGRAMATRAPQGAVELGLPRIQPAKALELPAAAIAEAPAATPKPKQPASKFKFIEDDDGHLRRGEKIYDIVGPDGSRTATAYVGFDGNTARVNEIYRLGKDGPNSLGPAAMRQILRDFQAAHPEINVVTGERVSGARKAANKPDIETVIPIRRDRP